MIYLGMIVPGMVLIPIFFALKSLRRLPLPAIMVFIYLCVSGICNALSIYWAMELHQNNMPWQHLNTAASFIFISLFYYHIGPGALRKKVILGILFAFTAFCIFNAYFLQGIYVLNSYASSPSAIILTIYCLLFFKDGLDGVEVNNNPAAGFSWFNTGFLLYFSGSIFLFLFGNKIYENLNLQTIIWMIHGTLALMMYILHAIGFERCPKK
jgi:hypothetical protein